MTRIGESSPGVSRDDGSTNEGPAVGSKFSGDNVAKAGPVTLRSRRRPRRSPRGNQTHVRFLAEDPPRGGTEFEERDSSTVVTESFSFPPPEGVQKFLYETVMRRSKSMVKGMDATLGRLKAALEA